MKKLKLYAEKKILGIVFKKGFVADAYVKDGNVIIESKNKKLKEEIERAINKALAFKENYFYYRTGEEYFNKKTGHWGHRTYMVYQKPADPKFLNALKDDESFWETKKFAGYEIEPLFSKIVEE